MSNVNYSLSGPGFASPYQELLGANQVGFDPTGDNWDFMSLAPDNRALLNRTPPLANSLNRAPSPEFLDQRAYAASASLSPFQPQRVSHINADESAYFTNGILLGKRPSPLDSISGVANDVFNQTPDSEIFRRTKRANTGPSPESRATKNTSERAMRTFKKQILLRLAGPMPAHKQLQTIEDRMGMLIAENNDLKKDLALSQREARADLAQSKADLAQSKADLTQTRSMLGQTRVDLGQTSAALVQTNNELFQSRLMLDQTSAALAQTKAGLTQTKSELDQTSTALAQKAADLTQTRSTLDQTSAALAQTNTELSQTKSSLVQVRADLEKKSAEQAQTISELINTKAALTQANKEVIRISDNNQFLGNTLVSLNQDNQQLQQRLSLFQVQQRLS